MHERIYGLDAPWAQHLEGSYIPKRRLRRVDPARRWEALLAVREYAEWAPEPTKAGGMSRWKQPYLVLTFCRLLHSAAEGRVGSKREAGEWALRTLDASWATLIQRALEEGPDPWERVHQEAEKGLVARTLAFSSYAVGIAARYEQRNRTPLG